MRIEMHQFIMAFALSWPPALAAQQELRLDWLQGGHVGSVDGLSFSPSGDFLATVSSHDHTAKRWSVPDGRLQETVKAWRDVDERPTTVAWSPAGNEVAFGRFGGTVEILDLDEGTSTTLDLKSPVRSLAWDPQGKKLLVGRDEPKVLIVSDGAISGDLIGNLGSIGDLAVSQDGLFVTGGCDDTRAYYWKLSTAHLELTLAGHERFSNVAISPNGAFLATTDGTKVRLWRTSNGNLLATYDESQVGAHEIEFVDDDAIVYVTHGRLRSRDMATGELVYEVATSGRRPALAFSPQTELLALGDHFGRVELRNARTGELVQRLVRDPMFLAVSIAVSPDGTRLVVGGARRTAHIRDAQTGSLIAAIATPVPPVSPAPPSIDAIDEIPPENLILDFDFSPDSAYVYGACNDGRLRKWNATTGVEVGGFQVSDYVCLALAVFNDGELALCGLGDATARVIQLSDGAELHMLQGHKRFLRAVAASPNGELLATGDNSGRVMVWNAGSGQLLFDLPKHRNAINQLDFSADGSMLASAGHDGVVKIWNTSDGSLLHELLHPSGDPSTLSPAYSATFAPVGSRIVTISRREVRFWDASDGSSIDWIVPESAFASDSAWFDDKLVFGREDGTVVMTTVP